MAKRLLILRSEKIFFPNGPHIYRYLAEKSGKKEEFEKLDKKYQDGKIKGPLLLREVVETILKGKKVGEVVENFIPYIKKYLNSDLETLLKGVKTRHYEIVFFSSYPRFLFIETNSKLGFKVDYIYGVETSIDKETRILGIKYLKFRDEKFVKEEMEKLGFQGKFTREPNRYGMLGKLIELMKKKNFTQKNTVLIGGSITAGPQMKLAGKVIREFDDLDRVLKEL